MNAQVILPIVFLSLVGLGAGVAIFIASRLLPKEDKSLQQAEEIKELLPGADCGACGYPGCFAYAQAVAKNNQVAIDSPCTTLAQDEEGMKALGKHLGLSLDVDSVGSKAVVHCTGSSEQLAAYSGVKTCITAVQLASGFKECPYACIGFADCVEVCPANAITINPEQGNAEVDWGKCIGCGKCVDACPQGLIELVPENMPQYLGCSYLSKKDIPQRKRCATGCLHCQICVKVSPNGEVVWNDDKDLPEFPADEPQQANVAIDKCPRKIILKTSAYEDREQTDQD